jgi:SNF2 family DNA or RNA helicase
MIIGKPLITLPERIVEDDGVSFFEEENKFYTELQTTSQAKIKNMITKGVLGKKYSCALVLLLRLRQACNHHHLVFFGESIETLDRVDVPVETMVQLAKELAPDVVERIRAEEANFECKPSS